MESETHSPTKRRSPSVPPVDTAKAHKIASSSPKPEKKEKDRFRGLYGPLKGPQGVPDFNKTPPKHTFLKKGDGKPQRKLPSPKRTVATNPTSTHVPPQPKPDYPIRRARSKKTLPPTPTSGSSRSPSSTHTPSCPVTPYPSDDAHNRLIITSPTSPDHSNDMHYNLSNTSATSSSSNVSSATPSPNGTSAHQQQQHQPDANVSSSVSDTNSDVKGDVKDDVSGIQTAIATDRHEVQSGVITPPSAVSPVIVSEPKLNGDTNTIINTNVTATKQSEQASDGEEGNDIDTDLPLFSKFSPTQTQPQTQTQHSRLLLSPNSDELPRTSPLIRIISEDNGVWTDSTSVTSSDDDEDDDNNVNVGKLNVHVATSNYITPTTPTPPPSPSGTPPPTATATATATFTTTTVPTTITTHHPHEGTATPHSSLLYRKTSTHLDGAVICSDDGDSSETSSAYTPTLHRRNINNISNSSTPLKSGGAVVCNDHDGSDADDGDDDDGDDDDHDDDDGNDGDGGDDDDDDDDDEPTTITTSTSSTSAATTKPTSTSSTSASTPLDKRVSHGTIKRGQRIIDRKRADAEDTSSSGSGQHKQQQTQTQKQKQNQKQSCWCRSDMITALSGIVVFAVLVLMWWGEVYPFPSSSVGSLKSGTRESSSSFSSSSFLPFSSTATLKQEYPDVEVRTPSDVSKWMKRAPTSVTSQTTTTTMKTLTGAYINVFAATRDVFCEIYGASLTENASDCQPYVFHTHLRKQAKRGLLPQFGDCNTMYREATTNDELMLAILHCTTAAQQEIKSLISGCGNIEKTIDKHHEPLQIDAANCIHKEMLLITMTRLHFAMVNLDRQRRDIDHFDLATIAHASVKRTHYVVRLFNEVAVITGDTDVAMVQSSSQLNQTNADFWKSVLEVIHTAAEYGHIAEQEILSHANTQLGGISKEVALRVARAKAVMREALHHVNNHLTTPTLFYSGNDVLAGVKALKKRMTSLKMSEFKIVEPSIFYSATKVLRASRDMIHLLHQLKVDSVHHHQQHQLQISQAVNPTTSDSETSEVNVKEDTNQMVTEQADPDMVVTREIIHGYVSNLDTVHTTYFTEVGSKTGILDKLFEHMVRQSRAFTNAADTLVYRTLQALHAMQPRFISSVLQSVAMSKHQILRVVSSIAAANQAPHLVTMVDTHSVVENATTDGVAVETSEGLQNTTATLTSAITSTPSTPSTRSTPKSLTETTTAPSSLTTSPLSTTHTDSTSTPHTESVRAAELETSDSVAIISDADVATTVTPEDATEAEITTQADNTMQAEDETSIIEDDSPSIIDDVSNAVYSVYFFINLLLFVAFVTVMYQYLQNHVDIEDEVPVSPSPVKETMAARVTRANKALGHTHRNKTDGLSTEPDQADIAEITFDEQTPIDRQESVNTTVANASTDQWKVVVKTGSDKYAGSDVHVKLTLLDSFGRGSKHALGTDKEYFEQGGMDTHMITTRAPMMAIQKLEVHAHQHVTRRHWKHPEWFCEWITLTNLASHKVFYFKVSAWFCKGIGNVRDHVVVWASPLPRALQNDPTVNSAPQPPTPDVTTADVTAAEVTTAEVSQSEVMQTKDNTQPIKTIVQSPAMKNRHNMFESSHQAPFSPAQPWGPTVTVVDEDEGNCSTPEFDDTQESLTYKAIPTTRVTPDPASPSTSPDRPQHPTITRLTKANLETLPKSSTQGHANLQVSPLRPLSRANSSQSINSTGSHHHRGRKGNRITSDVV